MKNTRYQLFGGAAIAYIGDFLIDTGLLQLSGVHHELYRVKDYASNLLVLRLASASTIKKLVEILPHGILCIQDVVVLSLSLYFMRMHLYSINGKHISASLRVYLLYCSMIYLTSVSSNVAIVTRRNICLGAIGNAFICMQKGVIAPRRTTSEPCEHSFGCERSFVREFTVCESCQIQERKRIKLHAMYASGNPQENLRKAMKQHSKTSLQPVALLRMRRTMRVKPKSIVQKLM